MTRDLLGAAALAQVGELGRGLVARGLGLGQRDLGVGALLAGDDLAGGDPVALARPTSVSVAAVTGARWTYSPST